MADPSEPSLSFTCSSPPAATPCGVALRPQYCGGITRGFGSTNKAAPRSWFSSVLSRFSFSAHRLPAR
jgi:hypothetical protein